MAARTKKAPPTPVRDAILHQLANPTLDNLWPLPVSYYCSRCGYAMLAPGSCRRVNSRRHPICRGIAYRAKVFRARCRCMNWTVTEEQLLTRCRACHRRIEKWDDEALLYALTRGAASTGSSAAVS